MATALLRAHTDTWIGEEAPNANHGAGVRLRVRGAGSGNERHALIFFPRPFPRGVTIVSATLRLYARNDWGAGSRTITVRRITEAWKENRVTWTTKPATTATSQGTVVVGNLANKELVEVDVTDLFADVSDGDPYHGLSIRLSTDEARSFYASDSPVDGVRAKLDLEWGGMPYPPSHLHPSSGDAISVQSPRLSWRFSDDRGNTEQAYSQVQVSTSADFTSPAYDSTKVANTRHSWPLAGNYNVPADSTRWWRAKVWDGTNLESGWSNAVSFKRLSKGTLTIVSPAASPNNFVEDTSPPIEWTFTGRTQERVRVRLLEVKANKSTTELWDFPRQVMTGTSVTIPSGILKENRDYRVQVWVWDTEDREAIPGDPDFVYAQRDFTYERDGTPDPPTSLVATLFGPGVVLTFDRVATPDYFAVKVDGDLVFDRIEPEDIRTDSNSFALTLWRLPPRVASTIEVEAVVSIGGSMKHSVGPSVSVTTNPTGIWLIDETTNQAVTVLGDEGAESTVGTSGETLRPLSRRRKVRIIDGFGGFEQSYSGEIDGDAAKDTLLEMFGAVYDDIRLVAANLNIPVEFELDGFSVTPTPTPGIGDRYEVSFGVFQTGEFFEVVG